MIIVNIDFKQIDQSRLKKVTRSNGKAASYGDLILIANKQGRDERGNDGFVKQGTSKEDREAKVEMPIIGNWKDMSGGKPAQRPAPPPARRPAPPADPDLDAPEDDIPF